MAGHEDLAQFGRLLRSLRLRNGLTQQELSTKATCSRSVISRAERAERLPDRPTAERLNDVLGAEDVLISRWMGAIDATSDAPKPALRWVHNYPATYHGLIWMRLSAAPEDDGDGVVIDIKWGRWRFRRRIRWPESREVTVWHTKGDDGFSIPVILRCSDPVLVTFRLGTPPIGAIDINPGWADEQD